MSLYIVVEGRRTEPRLLRGWLPKLAPGYSPAARVEDVGAQSYFVVPGRGYPSYHARIQAAAADIRQFPKFSWLVVMVDAEDVDASARRAEVQKSIDESGCPISSAILVADCCVETWLLGNRTMVRPKPSTPALQAHLAHYNVRDDDPERMPIRPGYDLRAQHHFDYLRAVFEERDMSFTKVNPGHAATPAYLDELRARTAVIDSQGSHLASFREVVEFFDRLCPALPAPAEPRA